MLIRCENPDKNNRIGTFLAETVITNSTVKNQSSSDDHALQEEDIKLQRMDDPDARYSIAFPDMKQYRGLWERLPQLAKERTTIDMLLIDSKGNIEVYKYANPIMGRIYDEICFSFIFQLSHSFSSATKSRHIWTTLFSSPAFLLL